MVTAKPKHSRDAAPDPDVDLGREEGAAPGGGPASPPRASRWAAMISEGFFARALDTGEPGEIYKASIRFAALVRRNMSETECRRVSVELILEAEAGDAS